MSYLSMFEEPTQESLDAIQQEALERYELDCKRLEIMQDIPLDRLRELAEAEREGKIRIPRVWTPCAEGLPTNERKGIWEEYEVTVCESHYPTCSYDPCDAPYSKEIVTTALFDDEQKIWHICRSKEAINALLKEDDYPLNGDVIVAWRDLPAPYRADDTTEKGEGGLDGK